MLGSSHEDAIKEAQRNQLYSVCIIPVQTEYTTNIQTEETHHITYVSSCAEPRHYLHTRRKDAVIGYLVLDSSDVHKIYNFVETSALEAVDGITLSKRGLPSLQFIWTCHCWVENNNRDTFNHELLSDFTIVLSRGQIYLEVVGDIPDSSGYTHTMRFSWNITDLMDEWNNHEDSPLYYAPTEYGKLRDAE